MLRIAPETPPGTATIPGCSDNDRDSPGVDLVSIALKVYTFDALFKQSVKSYSEARR